MDYSRVLDRCQELELALRRASDDLALERVVVWRAVDTHAPVRVLRPWMHGGEVLIAGPVIEQFLEVEVPDLPGPLGRPYAGLLERLRDALGRRLVDASASQRSVLL